LRTLPGDKPPAAQNLRMIPRLRGTSHASHWNFDCTWVLL